MSLDKLHHLPADMRALPQWVLAGADKVPLTVDWDTGKLRATSSTRPSEWLTFERACIAARHYADMVTTHVTREGVTVQRTGLDIGFVLHEADPFSCIDLDVKDAETHPGKPGVWTTTADFDRYLSIIDTMDSYTERSRSGKGVHVWVRGNIGRGFRRDGVEVYSQERYLIMTGDVYIDKPVVERGTILENMVGQMRPMPKATEQLVEVDPQYDDWYVFQTAAEASNRDKFWQLWEGRWEGEWESQSHADLALMSMFTFYTDSNAQCRRLFRASKLGKREKAAKDDRYVNLTLTQIRTRQAHEAAVELSALLKSRDMLAEAISEAQGGAAPADHAREVVQLSQPGQGDPVQPPPPAPVAVAQLAPVPPKVAQAGESGLAWPPGFVGTLAKFVYANSQRPIKEVAIVSALGLMAGIAGKAWHIPQSGLNLYIVLVARSAIGKEAMHTSIGTLVNACQVEFPQFGNFVDFNEYVSGPALVKACLASPSFLNVSGEWGRRLKRLAMEDGREGPLHTLRTQMTNLYQKSGPQSIAGGLGYSSADQSVASVAGVAYSMIGESTPGTFYEALTEGMMEDGFLSRFLIVGYDGDRPERNPSMIDRPDAALTRALADIAKHGYDLINKGTSLPVGRTEDAAAVMHAFETEADRNITSTDDESRRQMWNRASLKALRISALLAVGDNYASPAIGRQHIEWAIELVRQDIAMMSKRLDSGDVGSNDRSRERKLVSIIRDYIKRDKIPASYKVPEQMHKDGMVPRSYLQMRVGQVASFYNHKFGANKALAESIDVCLTNGWLMEVKHDKVVEMFNHHGKAYRVLELPDYSEQALK